MKISVSPNGTNHYDSASPFDEVLVATADGIVEISRSGSDWNESRRMLAGKHIASIAVDSQSGAVFAGTHKAGLWASEDGGKTWEERDNGIEFDNIYGLNCVRAGDELRIYAGTEPSHLYMSADFGKSWRELTAFRDVPSVDSWTFGNGGMAHAKNIIFDPRDPNTIYVGVEVGGAFKTIDSGKTWRELNDGGFYLDCHRMMIGAGRPDDVYMSTGRGIYHSPDGGGVWAKLPLPGVDPEQPYVRNPGISYPDALVIVPQHPDLMFTAGAASSPPGWKPNEGAYARIGRSRDAGHNWEYLEGGLPLNGRANIEGMTMNAYPGGFALVAATTDGDVFYSDDEGERWATIAEGLPPVSKAGHYRSVRDWEPAAAAAN